MANVKDYFDKVCYKAVYQLGDRVCGKINNIPFMGTVGNDNFLNDEEGPFVTVHLYLPVEVEGKVRNVLKVKHSDIRLTK
ncbi:MAG: hypothetical protein ACYDG4_18155 [Desulfuromonadaceae bacterium]|jgi:hypothetical protein